MKKHAGRVAVLLTLLLGVALALISVEWPLPAQVDKLLMAELAKQSISVRYKSATFDLLGHIRLAGVDGHYQGLLEFSARQIIVQPLVGGGFNLVFDKGQLHTGFLQLPIPETIQFSGALRQKNGRTTFRGLRLRANSLVMMVHGAYVGEQRRGGKKASATPNLADKVSDGQLSPTERVLAAFLASLCNDTTLWAGDVDLHPTGGTLSLAGHKLVLGDYTAEAPVLQVQYPFTGLFLSADAFNSKWGSFKDVSLNYSAEEGTLWRAIAQSAVIEDIHINAISASARWPIAAISNPAGAQDIEACAQLGENSVVTVVEGSLAPLSARLYGKVPSSLLAQMGLKIKADKPGNFSARLRDRTLFFNYTSSAGDFYGLDFSALSARGRISPGGAQIDRFKISGDGGTAQGSLKYNFENKEAVYTLTGEIDPLSLPWFGEGWTNAFEPFGHMRPRVALGLRVMPGQPVRASGIGGATHHEYRNLDLDKTVAAYRFDENTSLVNFHTFTGEEEARGELRFSPVFTGKLEGHMLPLSLAKAYMPEIPEVLKNIYFARPPLLTANISSAGYTVTAQTSEPVRFYALDFDGLNATVSSSQGTVRIDPVEFGFAGGRGGMKTQVDMHGVGYGSIWVRDANLGQWSLLGPLSEMFKFTTLKFNSLDGTFTLDPDKVTVDSLNLWGNEHAAQSRGVINTHDKTLDFTVHLKTLGGARPVLGLLAPIVQPFTSLMEARVSGPLEKPVWKIQLGSPFGL